ncbi:MAG TPA: DUF4912 domain-containing protein [Candidatus Omnitrophota bacterium]|nr:DUF4912 domain-containing protein [Candidatus Omnitrophota bacterium]
MKDLNSLSKKELLDRAKQLKIRMPYLYRKNELIKMIQKKEMASQAVPGTKPQSAEDKKPSLRGKKLVEKVSSRRDTAGDTKPYYEPTYHTEAAKDESPSRLAVIAARRVAPSAPKGELPLSYEQTKIVLMVRDPYWAFVYWDISTSTIQKVTGLMREHYGKMRPILRVYDVTDIDFNGKNAHWNFDMDVILDAKNWYIHVGIPNRSYLVDLGLLDAQNNFYLVARSNVAKTPRDVPSDVIDEEWMAVDFEEIYALSGGFGVGLSSAEFKERKKQLLEQMVSSPGFGITSPGVTSPGMWQKGKRKGFFFEVWTELLVYGRTMPDAKVTVSGEKIQLRPDGTFSLRYFLPDGDKNLPIQAVSRDEDDTRKAEIRVKKDTIWG